QRPGDHGVDVEKTRADRRRICCTQWPIVSLSKPIPSQKGITGMSATMNISFARAVLAGVSLFVASHVTSAQTVDANWPNMTWDQVTAEAKGQTVKFWHWGGDPNWNKYFVNILGDAVKDKGVTIETVLIDDTVEAVNKVLAEVEAGQKTNGSVDMIWINGENFVTLQQAKLLFGPYTDKLPNFANMAPDSSALHFDFGYPINGYESPQGSSQFTLSYNSKRVANPPKTVE